jgi:putative addiction module killer protein
MNVIQTTSVFDAWLERLSDRMARAAVKIRISRAEDGNFGDCKPIGEGYLKCVSTLGLAIGSTLNKWVQESTFCWLVGASQAKAKTLKRR